jgi:hypothetical protein
MAIAVAAAPPGGGQGVPAVANNPLVGTSPGEPGVLGRSNTGPGLRGESIGEGGGDVGGAHQVFVPPGDGVFGQGSNGVHGVGNTGVLGEGNTGVRGRSAAPSNSGVLGEHLLAGWGVYGSSASGDGVCGSGAHNGVHGKSSSATDSGVLGENTGIGYGVRGATSSPYVPGPGGTAGVWGSNSGSGTGVKGTSQGGDAVAGFSSSSSHSGVAAINDAGGSGLWARGTPAGHFEGKVEVTGDLGAGNITAATVGCLNGLNIVGNIAHVGGVVHLGGDVNLGGNLSCIGDISLTHADCAEEFDISPGREIQPGTVVVIDDDGKLVESSKTYDRRVAGVVSGAGGLQPGIILGRIPRHSATRIALIGRVFCQVDASQSPIEMGDLLTSSAIPGHAMKATDPIRAFGAVIGKALQPLRNGQGMIPVLVSLQ